MAIQFKILLRKAGEAALFKPGFYRRFICASRGDNKRLVEHRVDHPDPIRLRTQHLSHFRKDRPNPSI